MASLKDRVPVPDSELVHLPGAVPVAPANPNEVAEVTLLVRGKSTDDEIQTLLEREGQRRIRERRYLTPDQFALNHGATEADILKVLHFANENSLSVVGASPRRRVVRMIGTLANLSKAFDVRLSIYRSSRGAYRGHDGPVNITYDLKDIVEGVFGLDTKPQSTNHLRSAPPPKLSQPLAGGITFSAASSGYTPVQVASLYDFPAGLNGSGQTVGILEFGGGYRMSDLNAYFQMLGLPTTPNVVSVSVLGATNAPTGNSNGPDAEVLLDIEVVGAVAPGAQIVVYFAPNNTLGWIQAIATAVHDAFYKPSIISISWGGPEATWSRQALRALNYEFMAAGLLGITVCAATAWWTSGRSTRAVRSEVEASCVSCDF